MMSSLCSFLYQIEIKPSDRMTIVINANFLFLYRRPFVKSFDLADF